jgi:hypothetical protein
MPKVRKLTQRDWEQLLVIAAGYLPLCNGDLRAAMGRALTAHADLIAGVKAAEVHAFLPDGRITMFVPDEGGVAIRLERLPPLPEGDEGDEEPLPTEEDSLPPRDPLEITFEVFESAPSHHRTPQPESDAGVHEEGDWTP